MTYEVAAHFVQTWGLVFFVTGFVLVLTYTLWPANKRRFKEAAQIPLHDETLNEDGTIPERMSPTP